MHGWREDPGGWFCGICGRELHAEGTLCAPPATSADLEWSVIVQTLLDTLVFDDSERPRVCHFNQDTRERALDGAKRYLADSERRSRLQYSRRA
jgi:hypothetical protein